MNQAEFKYKWATWGDLNAFFGLMLDNVTNLVILWGLLAAAGFPRDIYFHYMVPGTALGVLVGDLVYTYMAFRLAKKTKNPDVTAMPLGLDTPSTIGVALAVLVPCFTQAKQTMSVHEAALVAWKVGMATLIFMGLVKVMASFAGRWVQKVIPRAGLLGSLAGVGVTLLGFIPIYHMYGMPAVGLISLGLLVYTLVAKLKLPGNFPGAFAAVVAGTIVYYVLGFSGLLAGHFRVPQISFDLAFPMPNLLWTEQLSTALAYLPFAVPFGLLTIVGGINVTESARCAGDDYNTRDILLTEAIATLIAGTCGGVVQSTPYIGHPAYKSMGGRAAYTLATGLFVGLGGIFGYIPWIVDAIPAAAVAPILLFVGLEITVQAFQATEQKHHPAVFIALIPVVGELVRIAITNVIFSPGSGMPSKGTDGYEWYLVSILLGHGFIITSMLLAAIVAKLIDKDLLTAAAYLLTMAFLTFFGFIHSISPNGDIYLPWKLPQEVQHWPFRLAATYLVLAAALFLAHLSSRKVKSKS